MHAQYLQHMQTGPLGGQEILREDDDRMRRHNERVFKTMTEEELALEVRRALSAVWTVAAMRCVFVAPRQVACRC